MKISILLNNPMYVYIYIHIIDINISSIQRSPIAAVIENSGQAERARPGAKMEGLNDSFTWKYMLFIVSYIYIYVYTHQKKEKNMCFLSKADITEMSSSLPKIEIWGMDLNGEYTLFWFHQWYGGRHLWAQKNWRRMWMKKWLATCRIVTM